MQINISTNWIDIIKNETTKSYWHALETKVDQAYEKAIVYPTWENIFKCFDYFNFEQTKVVIIGQDPYHGPNQANGLSFSVNSNAPLPKSLINIYKELRQDLGVVRENGDLSSWAKQGVLLLNNTLTVEQSKPNSHCEFGWTEFTNNIIKYINDNLHQIIFVLWGNFAQTKIQFIDTSKHYIIESPHPSPFSAYYGFFGSKPFSKINNLLKLNNKAQIDWQ